MLCATQSPRQHIRTPGVQAPRARTDQMAPILVPTSSAVVDEAIPSPNVALHDKKWAKVKTWTFANLLANNVLLEDAIRNDKGVSHTEEKRQLTKKGNRKATTGVNDWDCAYSRLKMSPKGFDAGNNDWDCSYRLKPCATRPTISASSSTSTLLSDAEGSHSRQSIDEGLEHEETVLEEFEFEQEECDDTTRHIFDIVRIIGSGSYGTVLLCRLRACPNRLYAVKVVYKSKLRNRDGNADTTRQVQRLLTEKNILCSVTHPFITKMYCSFETPDALNYVLEYCPGGDMYFLLEKFPQKRLPEDHVRFYAASIALALRYLHHRGIMYRDLKPENILLDEAGFLRLADFGLAHEHMNPSEQNCTSFCGSADYVAPEVIRGNGYGLAADLWSFGCVVYEMLTGFPPFYSQHDRALLFDKIKSDEPGFPRHCSPPLCDFLSGLLHKESSQRLGNGPNGMQEIFDHPFFANISWHRLKTKQVVPPLVPNLACKLDTSNFENQFTSQLVDGHLVYEERGSHRACAGKDDNSFYFGEFDWCAGASHFQENDQV